MFRNNELTYKFHIKETQLRRSPASTAVRLPADLTIRPLPQISPGLGVIVSVRFDNRASPAEIAAFKNAVIACPLILHSVELTGAFDFMVEAAVTDMAAYDLQIKSIARPLAGLVSRFEASFICARNVRKDEAIHPIWLPCPDGVRRIEMVSIDKVKAEGDYMRVHSRGGSWLVHATMRSFINRLASEHFLKLHRSALVRCDFIERIYRESGHWVAELNDGTHERVAKSHVSETLKRLRVPSATTEAITSNKGPLNNVRA